MTADLTAEDFRFVYRERARLVAFLAAVFPSVTGIDDAEPDWPVVYVKTPEGQLSWHLSRDDLDLFPHVPRAGNVTWDGHSTAEKHDRLARLTAKHAAALLESRTVSIRDLVRVAHPDWHEVDVRAEAARMRAEIDAGS